ncbi:hypothetical protein ACQEVC_16115 [Plantactinospora sp. CA-294935]|uniref:hypothetical protein n=1 Tax=Plantactinospora sp. CA-294935 TaxID=3240012 RepID=UPI003D8EEDCC
MGLHPLGMPGSVPLGSVLLGSVLLGSVPLGSVPLGWSQAARSAVGQVRPGRPVPPVVPGRVAAVGEIHPRAL